MTILLIGLIISMLVMAYRLFAWIRGVIFWFVNPEGKTPSVIKALGVTKWAYIIGGIEHLIMFGSLLAATLIIY